MTAASLQTPAQKSRRGKSVRRAPLSRAKADALQGETGRHWRGAAGYGSKRPHTDRGDNVGIHPLPAGACSNLQRPDGRAASKAGWRHWGGRMSQYELRRLGNAGQGGAGRLPEAGSACVWQRGSRQVADDMTWLRLDTEPGSASPRQRRRAEGITRRPRGVCGQALEPRGDTGRSFGESCRCQPDSGNPTVRDERGARGNVSHGGTRNPRRISKERLSVTSAYSCARHVSTRQNRIRSILSTAKGSFGRHRPLRFLPARDASTSAYR
jgi:hypothetical protein